jgi:hypothetical protein
VPVAASSIQFRRIRAINSTPSANVIALDGAFEEIKASIALKARKADRKSACWSESFCGPVLLQPLLSRPLRCWPTLAHGLSDTLPRRYGHGSFLRCRCFLVAARRPAATLSRGNSATAYPAQCVYRSVNPAAFFLELLKDGINVHAGILTFTSGQYNSRSWPTRSPRNPND